MTVCISLECLGCTVEDREFCLALEMMQPIWRHILQPATQSPQLCMREFCQEQVRLGSQLL